LPPPARYAKFTEILEVVCKPFADALPSLDDAQLVNIDWEATADYYGAFKLQYPGQDSYAQAAFFQFQSVLDSDSDRGVYLAGDSVSWAGGWTEGALHTGLNAACAVIQRFGGQFFAKTTPLNIKPNLYTYSD
jgi:tryptophan 2-monooxygenase